MRSKHTNKLQELLQDIDAQHVTQIVQGIVVVAFILLIVSIVLG